MPRPDFPPDPWGLSERQRQALIAMAQLGSQKLAAERMGIKPPTLAVCLGRVKATMGVRTITCAVIAWVRFEEACNMHKKIDSTALRAPRKQAKLSACEQCEEVT